MKSKIEALKTDRQIVSNGFKMTTAALPDGGGAVFVFEPIGC